MELKKGRIVRLYVGGNQHIADIMDVVSNYFPAATVYSATGLWKQETEITDVVEIFIGDSAPEFSNVRALRSKLKEEFDQESVGMVVLDAEGDF